MEVQFTLNEEPVRCPEGLTVAGALFLLGSTTLRRTPRRDAPRSLFCGMGACFDCIMEIDGRPNVRACVTPVREGMVVAAQRGDSRLGPPPGHPA